MATRTTASARRSGDTNPRRVWRDPDSGTRADDVVASSGISQPPFALWCCCTCRNVRLLAETWRRRGSRRSSSARWRTTTPSSRSAWKTDRILNVLERPSIGLAELRTALKSQLEKHARTERMRYGRETLNGVVSATRRGSRTATAGKPSVLPKRPTRVSTASQPTRLA